MAGSLQLIRVSMGRAYIAGMIGALVLATGCPGPSPPGIDAGDDDGGNPDDDSGLPAGGLTFDFVADPSLPTDPDGAALVVISKARYQLADVRAIGDAAPGDDRTSRSSFEMQLEQAPVRLPFPEAPQGIYSFLLADVVSYEIEGTVQVDSGSDAGVDEIAFEIHDQPPDLELSIDLAGLVVGAQPVTCVIEVDLRRITREIDWASEEPDGEDGIEIEYDHPDIDKVRDKANDFRKQ